MDYQRGEQSCAFPPSSMQCGIDDGARPLLPSGTGAACIPREYYQPRASLAMAHAERRTVVWQWRPRTSGRKRRSTPSTSSRPLRAWAWRSSILLAGGHHR